MPPTGFHVNYSTYLPWLSLHAGLASLYLRLQCLLLLAIVASVPLLLWSVHPHSSTTCVKNWGKPKCWLKQLTLHFGFEAPNYRGESRRVELVSLCHRICRIMSQWYETDLLQYGCWLMWKTHPFEVSGSRTSLLFTATFTVLRQVYFSLPHSRFKVRFTFHYHIHGCRTGLLFTATFTSYRDLLNVL
jgi:hypothetical protein